MVECSLISVISILRLPIVFVLLLLLFAVVLVLLQKELDLEVVYFVVFVVLSVDDSDGVRVIDNVVFGVLVEYISQLLLLLNKNLGLATFERAFCCEGHVRFLAQYELE